jgi:hypothetical protein
MQTTLRIDDQIYRTAKAEAARRGLTLTRFIEEALRAHVKSAAYDEAAAVADRNAMMERLLQATAHFRVGARPTRADMNER